ncbi:TIGR03087 family PEP-CTERM/XrtA system glycosyltransferase [Novosphingobium sp. M1R2S20]|uniref:TIGR03087 family PEP-CTERM/XrtA system glycosyltransferase n=1 Tax=Novosphingobium rhizovicinum TaxID=3228928 RepID=A0ABV3RFQ7_9SPHN
MSEILFLAHRIPFPPDRGDKIRSYHILRHLAREAPVHVATFADDVMDGAAEDDLRHLAASYCLVSRTKPLPIAGIEAIATRRPISFTAFRSRRMRRYVEDLLARRPTSLIYVFSGQMGQYVPTHYSGRVVADFVDVDSAKFEAYALRDGGPKGWAEKREATLLRVEEARLARRAETSLLISEEEAALFRSRLPQEGREQVQVRKLANGIDSTAFDRRCVAQEPQMQSMAFPRLVFTGQMDYAPNVDACLRAAERILPLVRREFPQATFHVVGRSPVDRLRALSGRNGVHVWGRVPDVRPWLAAADLALVPLEIGRGVQNKVLEAMAMALPVVLTPEAATGIGGVDGRDFMLAATDEQLAEACTALLRNPVQASAIAEAARAYVVAHASWEAALGTLSELTQVARPKVRHAA